jgi:hypothetical protein
MESGKKAYSAAKVLVVGKVRIEKRLLQLSPRDEDGVLIVLDSDLLPQLLHRRACTTLDLSKGDDVARAVFDPNRFRLDNPVIFVGDGGSERFGVPDDGTGVGVLLVARKSFVE